MATLETEEEFLYRMKDAYHAIGKGIPLKDKERRHEAFKHVIQWYIERGQLLSERVLRKGQLEKELRRAAAEFTSLVGCLRACGTLLAESLPGSSLPAHEGPSHHRIRHRYSPRRDRRHVWQFS